MVWLFCAASYVSSDFSCHDAPTTEIYTLSLHDALPISTSCSSSTSSTSRRRSCRQPSSARLRRDRKSTRLNSSHQIISYAVFCLQKKIVPTPLNRLVRR